MKITTREFNTVRKLVHERAAVVLEPGKEYLVESRLNLLAAREGYPSIHKMIERLSEDSPSHLERQVVEAMVTHETAFFRDLRPFEILRTVVIPDLMARRAATRTLHVWSAASSGGQEPHSIAMIIRNYFPALDGWKVQMIASDISRAILDRARDGLYSQMEINRGLPAALLVKYFEKKSGQWQIRRDIRRMLEFREINLAEAWPHLPAMDIIFLRNVLIYFDVETRKKIFARLHRLLKPDGYLFLGSSETIVGIDDGFEPLLEERSACYRIKKSSA